MNQTTILKIGTAEQNEHGDWIVRNWHFDGNNGFPLSNGKQDGSRVMGIPCVELQEISRTGIIPAKYAATS